MIRLLLDQGLSPLAATRLRAEGWDAVHTAEIGMDQADDARILDKAREEERVCITLDHDFHAHLALSRHGRPSVVLLRVQGLDAERQADLIRRVCWQCQEALQAVSADAERIGVRRLPLRGSPVRHYLPYQTSRLAIVRGTLSPRHHPLTTMPSWVFARVEQVIDSLQDVI